MLLEIAREASYEFYSLTSQKIVDISLYFDTLCDVYKISFLNGKFILIFTILLLHQINISIASVNPSKMINGFSDNWQSFLKKMLPPVKVDGVCSRT